MCWRSADPTTSAISEFGADVARGKAASGVFSKRSLPRKPTRMRFCDRIARPAAGDVTSRTGGFSRSRRYSAG
jgi:hypothetical protein